MKPISVLICIASLSILFLGCPSETQFVEVTKPAPELPALVSPANNTGILPLNPGLSWLKVDEATEYILQVSTNSSFSSFVFNGSVSLTNRQLSGLSNYTKYYWRVYAKNDYGISLPSVVWSFTTTTTYCPGLPTVTYSGVTYNTVQIGTQCWLKENLNYGKMINSASASSNNGIIEKYCYNNDSANCAIYGALYTWSEAMQYTSTEGARGLCPPGWHIPASHEYNTLSSAAGDDANALKAIGQGFSDGAGTNKAGFQALLGGQRSESTGTTYGINQYTYLWSSSYYQIDVIYKLYLTLDSGIITYSNYCQTHEANSLRCVKD